MLKKRVFLDIQARLHLLLQLLSLWSQGHFVQLELIKYFTTTSQIVNINTSILYIILDI